jgi:glycosyltransferase involved in cell wall biosynthesis
MDLAVARQSWSEGDVSSPRGRGFRPRRIINLVTVMEAAGAQGAAMRLAESFRSRGHHAETWFLYVKRPVYIDCEHVRVVFPHRPSAVSLPRLVIRLQSMLRDFGPDCVFSFTHYASALGSPVAALAGVKARIATVRRPFTEYPTSARIVNRVLGSLGVSSRTIAVSASTAASCERLPRSFRKRLHTVLNGIDPNSSSLTPAEARRRFGIPSDVKLVLSAGRLSPEKNQVVLVDMLSRLPDVHLAVAGEGPSRQLLCDSATQLGVERQLHLLGELPPAEVADFLAMDGPFLFPSRFEAFGFAVVEAMAAGLPVVASDIPAMREILGDSGSSDAGVRVSPDNAGEWAVAVSRLLEDRDWRQSLSSRARDRARDFSLERMVSGYESVMEEVLQSARESAA